MKRWLFAGAAVLAVLVVAGGAAMAQEGDDGTSFLDRVAAKLGIETRALEQAMDEARDEEIDEAVANGRLTEEQGERLKERADRAPSGPGLPFRGGFHMGFAMGFGLCASLDELAEFLGVQPETLREELRAEGATLGSVAEAHGKSRDELRAFLLERLSERLSTAVESGRITQERADEIQANAEQRIDGIIDGEFPGRGRFKFRFDGEMTPPSDEDPTGGVLSRRSRA
jgi:hypothetical protein